MFRNNSNRGKQWRQQGASPLANGHDFPNPEVKRVYPYGVYDIGTNRGFVHVGTDHDTATFAVASVRRWWINEGRRLYPSASRLTITADGSGSNGSRLRPWKWELHRLAKDLKIDVCVSHFQPGTSKWNKAEHRLFSFISSNWRGEPLNDYFTIVNLIANTTTATGLEVKCKLDKRRYPKGRKITDKMYAVINLARDEFHGEWSYIIKCHRP